MNQDILKSLITYDPISGNVMWKNRDVSMFSHCKNPSNICSMWNTRFGGQVSGCVKIKNEKKYYQITFKINGIAKSYIMHRIIWLYIHGEYPSGEIDHIDQDGLNNSLINLRDIGHADNQKNKSRHKNNKSGESGISWSSKYSKWCVSIRSGGKRVCYKMISDFNDAIALRDSILKKYNFTSKHGGREDGK